MQKNIKLNLWFFLLLLFPVIAFADATPLKTETDKAVKEYKTSLNQKPKKGDGKKSISSKKDTAESTSKQERKELHKKNTKAEAEELLSAGRLAEAIKILISAIRKEPNNYELRYLLANSFYEFGMPNKAIEEYNNVLKLKPDFAPAHIKLGMIHKKKGNTDLALREFAQAAELMPNNLELKYQLGKIYLERGMKDKALEEFRSTLITDPAFYQANLIISDILVEAKDYDNAIEELKLASIYSPKNPEIHYKLGKIYICCRATKTVLLKSIEC